MGHLFLSEIVKQKKKKKKTELEKFHFLQKKKKSYVKAECWITAEIYWKSWKWVIKAVNQTNP